MIVADASAIMELLASSRGRALSGRLLSSGESLHAPHLLDVEVAHALRRYVRTGLLDARRGALLMRDLVILPLHRYPHDVLLGRVWDLRENLTAYDASYVALAEVLGAPLVTCDEALARAQGHEVSIEIL